MSRQQPGKKNPPLAQEQTLAGWKIPKLQHRQRDNPAFSVQLSKWDIPASQHIGAARLAKAESEVLQLSRLLDPANVEEIPKGCIKTQGFRGRISDEQIVNIALETATTLFSVAFAGTLTRCCPLWAYSGYLQHNEREHHFVHLIQRTWVGSIISRSLSTYLKASPTNVDGTEKRQTLQKFLWEGLHPKKIRLPPTILPLESAAEEEPWMELYDQHSGTGRSSDTSLLRRGLPAGRKSGRSSRTWTRKKKATQYFPHLAPVATADRHPWVAAFQDLPTGEAFEHKGRTARASGIYINTTGTSSRGLTLTRVAHVILMETDWRSTNHKQVFGRCHRIGQRAKVVFTYVFQNTQIECEQLALRTWR
ncbi:uncharacterized protein BO96DRAFT_482665 [Aspergillus niger CBS 101883]|uniref:Contig An04c0060, genomic contig n=2 Tax=Aspergillus niger TaxID=5061 RepID=A2QHT9_ASPNC|nr:uncharacterized protein BO96DRAFT_482665 [Aspergillus niger CBS 101883]XP_059600467.1 uncharacterized protein An04g01020 [Aspergillus niger]PYH53086.1 hypothetical protein BO96DRAFT_482665 [Aspergillus niger CBS 101883]CAK38559.1 unnamed protein product [Aspergillus niger]